MAQKNYTKAWNKMHDTKSMTQKGKIMELLDFLCESKTVNCPLQGLIYI